MTAATAGLIVPDLAHEHYGIPVSWFGEDGHMVALGHHDPRRAFAAFRRHARRDIGLTDGEAFGNGLEVDPADGPVLDRITHAWATFTATDDGEWYGLLGKTAATPGALPVTVYDSGA